jgi:hypothetical protein
MGPLIQADIYGIVSRNPPRVPGRRQLGQGPSQRLLGQGQAGPSPIDGGLRNSDRDGGGDVAEARPTPEKKRGGRIRRRTTQIWRQPGWEWVDTIVVRPELTWHDDPMA